MAINYGIEILIDAAVTADKKAEIVRRIIQVLEYRTLSVAYAATYAAGTTSVNQQILTVT